MTETLEAIRARHACRSYSDEPVPAETLRTIAEAGLRAPSAMNRQPWRVIAVSNQGLIAELEAAGSAALQAADPAAHDRIKGRGGKLLYNCQALVIVAQQVGVEGFPASMDVGIVASHVSLAATSLGVDNVIAALPGFGLRGEGGAELASRLGVPEGFEFAISILLGHAAGDPGTQHETDWS
ncbi:MAG: nitroreductase family protein, partial [Propionibacteriaceae bacterium]|nr:nitroreductase family protein [Propionibacteriaceae bacterium]